MSDADTVKTITDQLEATYQSLRAAAANISGLLSIGVATCDEVKAYNLWALATYNAQRGMLQTLAANGEQGIPDSPPYPTLFVWNDQTGEDAYLVDCSGQPSSLSGLMKHALRGPDPSSQYLGLDKIKIVTTQQANYNPQGAPDFATLIAAQNQQGKGLGIGALVVLIIVAGISLTVYAAVSALLKYLEASKLDEEVTKQTKQQADAFANYTSARLQCYQACVNQGTSAADCVATCTKIVEKPNIKLPCLPGETGSCTQWGALQWIGLTVVIGAVSLIAYKIYEHKKTGAKLFPDFHFPELPGPDEHEHEQAA